MSIIFKILEDNWEDIREYITEKSGASVAQDLAINLINSRSTKCINIIAESHCLEIINNMINSKGYRLVVKLLNLVERNK